MVSILMLAVPVIPHHHHEKGTICLKNDVTAQTCCDDPQHSHDQEHHHEDACCSDECLTRIHTPELTGKSPCGHPHYHFFVTLFTEPLLRILTQPDEKTFDDDFIYIESLHGTFLTRVTGLRAPPCILS
ncbi:MAG: hypothetical protein LIP08_02370 [Bacteroides sp.]|nr:hypothetical protein [Bacteroides sp.]